MKTPLILLACALFAGCNNLGSNIQSGFTKAESTINVIATDVKTVATGAVNVAADVTKIAPTVVSIAGAIVTNTTPAAANATATQAVVPVVAVPSVSFSPATPAGTPVAQPLPATTSFIDKNVGIPNLIISHDDLVKMLGYDPNWANGHAERGI